ncbi:MAG: pyridoxal-phosphate dependent enzyme [Dehalococcoidia bacterium]|nr:pyridoxal-phosphate dependent enzyme [Dehalococcoidia bacterium]
MTIPLFKSYPALEKHVPWISLGQYPTPVQKLENLGRAVGYPELWIKRDDLSSNIYGGNKIRKLEFAIADALNKKKKYMITVGGIGTNHGLATTIHCNRAGIKTALVLIPQPITEKVQENLLLDQHFGADINVGRSTMEAYLRAVWVMLTHPNFYLLWAGGTSPLSTLGYVNAALELKQQIDAGLLPEPKYVFGATGSMGTTAGLIVGCRLAGLKSRIVGVKVSMDAYSNVKGTISLCNRTIQMMRKHDPSVPDMRFTASDFDLEPGFFGGEYGRVTPEGRAAVDLIKKTEGIGLETTYTGKTLAAMLDFIKKGGSPDGAPLLFWNTYNSVDYSETIKKCGGFKTLPKSAQWVFKENLISYLK